MLGGQLSGVHPGRYSGILSMRLGWQRNIALRKSDSVREATCGELSPGKRSLEPLRRATSPRRANVATDQDEITLRKSSTAAGRNPEIALRKTDQSWARRTAWGLLGCSPLGARRLQQPHGSGQVSASIVFPAGNDGRNIRRLKPWLVDRRVSASACKVQKTWSLCTNTRKRFAGR